MGLVGCGSDTVNSLRSPASAGIVGFRPSVGRVCTSGVVPVSSVQDVVYCILSVFFSFIFRVHPSLVNGEAEAEAAEAG